MGFVGWVLSACGITAVLTNILCMDMIDIVIRGLNGPAGPYP